MRDTKLESTRDPALTGAEKIEQSFEPVTGSVEEAKRFFKRTPKLQLQTLFDKIKRIFRKKI